MKFRAAIQFFLICCLISVSHTSMGQSELKEMLQGKTRLADIMAEVEKYYSVHPELKFDDFESEYLHWKRWEWYMSGRLGHGGEFVNIPQMLVKGIAEKKRMPQPDGERNINSGWSFLGPSSSTVENPAAWYDGIGRVDRITFHPTNPNIIYLGTPAGGLWNTLNGGGSWSNLTDHLPGVAVSGIVISWDDPGIQYILTGDGDSDAGGLVEDFGYMRPSIGVLKTIDGGISWFETTALPGTGNDPYTGYKLVQSPTDPDVLFAATSVGLYHTTDGGNTWFKRVTGRHFDVEFKPGDANTIYSTVQGDFWMSTNGGLTWTSNSTYDFDPANCANNVAGRIMIAVCPSSPSRVYLLSGPASIGGFCGVWLSINSGISFTRQSNTPNILGRNDNGGDGNGQTMYDLGIACHPDFVTNIVTAGLTLWRSTTSGVTWTHLTSFNESGAFPYIHPDVHDIAYNPLNDFLYAATDGGFFKSEDNGTTWEDLSDNIETSQFYHMAGWDGNQHKLLGGLQDNGTKYRRTNSSTSFHIWGGDGFDGVFDPNTGEPLYTSNNQFVLRYTDDGDNVFDATPDEDSIFFKTIAVHNTDPDILIVGTNDIFKSTDGGLNYTNRAASGSWAITSCPSNSTRFYSAGGSDYGNGAGALYFSSNTGDNWTNKSNTPGFPSSANWIKITDVAVRPNNSAHVWACFGGFDDGYKVVMSLNTGDSWTNMSANLPNVPINCLAIDNDNGVYAGTDIGVFYRSPTMTQWMTWSNALPNVPVTELVIFDDGVIRKIRAATFGRGVWESNLAGTCDAAVVVTGNIEGIRHYEASNSITSTSFIQGGIGTFVSYQSGNFITLSEGFNVVDDSEFLGFISPCGQGGIPDAAGVIDINRADPNSSIIPLRRMWNQKTGLPYGSITGVTVENDKAKIKFTLQENGKVEIIAARHVQETLNKLYSSETHPGPHEFEADISKLPKEFHYVMLFVDGKLAHFQELDLR